MAVDHGITDFSGVGVIPPYVPFELKGKTVKGKRILVVAGDRGGWNALEPPLRRALDEGCEVRLCLVGTCAQQLATGKLLLDSRMVVVTEKIQDAAFRSHDLLVVGASQSAEGIEAVVRAMMLNTKPLLTVQDLYGSSIPTFQALHGANLLSGMVPRRVCTTDQFSHDHFISALPHLSSLVVITGGPQFDKVLEVKQNWAEHRQQLRKRLRVAEDSPVFLIAGQLNGTAEALVLLTEAIMECGLDTRAKIIVRPHPRSTDLDKLLLDCCEELYDLVSAYSTLLIDSVDLTKSDLGKLPSEDLLPAVDYAVSGYSTTNYYGILYEMPGVIYLGTPSFHWDLWQEKKLLRPPEVEAGAGWYVESLEDFVEAIKVVQAGDTSSEVQALKQRQQVIVQYNDGHATDRVWTQMAHLLNWGNSTR